MGIFSGTQNNSQPKKRTGGIFSSVIQKPTEQKSVKPYAGVDSRGFSTGFSEESDTSSRRFFAYRKPGDTSTTTDYSRVATNFNPRVATTTPRDSFYNPRDSRIGNSNPNDQIDHKMALALSGSNHQSNLRTVPNAQNRDGDIVRDLQGNVIGGRSSLAQAQTDLAIQKGLPLPETGSRYGQFKLEQIKAEEEAKKLGSFGGIFKNTLKGLIPTALRGAEKVGEKIQETFPGVRAVSDAAVQRNSKILTDYIETIGSKEHLAKLTGDRDLVYKDETGKFRFDPVAARQKENFTMGFIDGGTNKKFLQATKPKIGKIVKEDLFEMRDFTDYVNGAYKPTNKIQSEIDARRIAEKYGINPDLNNRALADRFNKVLDERLNLKDIQPRDAVGRYSQIERTIPRAKDANISNTSSRIINLSLPPKKSMFQTAVDNLKNPRMSKGGFIKNPLADDSDLFRKKVELGSTQPPKAKGQYPTRLKALEPKAGSPLINSSLTNDARKLANSKVNLSTYKLTSQGQDIVKNAVDDIKPKIEAKVGAILSNQEALDFAEKSSRIMNQAAGRQATLEWESALIRSRQKLAQAAESGAVDREFIETLMSIKSQATDIGRKLQSFSIAAEAKDITSKQAIIEAVLKVTNNVDEILAAAKNVDFTNLKEATEFYRKFIKPTSGEWIDLLRYNSMLSSPKTHIVNVFSNAINSTVIPVVEKIVAGGVDFLGATLTGRNRQMFAGEGLQYASAYVKNIKEATKRFSDVMRGTRRYSNLDIKNLPVSVTGIKGKIASTLSYPMRLLEGTDQFFVALTEGGEKASLAFRKSRGGILGGNIEEMAQSKAAYRLYRRELFSDEQGAVLDALDQATQVIQGLRNNKNPIVSTVAKFTVPFLQTPMNIFKQGIEYSPLGVSTVFGAKNKTEQITKAIIGSSVFASAALLLTSNRLSWAEPINADERNKFRDAGKQAYSIKIGNKWVSYQKLPPPIAFPFAMVSLIDDSLKNRKIDQTNGEMILATIAKYGSFLSDQSYAKSIGDLMTAVQGGESSISKLISNYPQQLVPFRALSGWMARLTDGLQRKVDSDASFIDKQVQLMMMNIPGLSTKVPARVNERGEEIPQQSRFLNAVSPVNVSTENTEKAIKYDQNNYSEAMKIDKELQMLDRTQANKRAKEIQKSNPELYKKLLKVIEDRKLNLNDDEKKMRTMGVTNGERARYINESILALPKDQRNARYQELKQKKVITPQVDAQLREMN